LKAAQSQLQAKEAELTRCKKKLKGAEDTIAERENIQRAIEQKMVELAQLRRELAASR
jgi:hypothetical protein